jgi:hypothetical protein
MVEDNQAVSRRTAIKATSVAFAAGVGAVGSASASSHCTENNCVETSTEAEAYDTCGASSPSKTIYAGRDGFVGDTCTVDGVKYAEVAFECKEIWWIECADLESSFGCMC